MADFSTILQDPTIRGLVQDNLLERTFHDALFPRLLFRGETSPVLWPANVGDNMTFTGAGLIAPQMRPLTPGVDPVPSAFSAEQWTAQLNQYGGTIDTHMPTSIAAIANLFLRNAQQLGLASAQSLNRLVRDRLYNAALAGQTVVDVAASATTQVHVKRLNGFTRARRPDLVTGAPVKFDFVSTNNPLPIVLFDNATEAANTVVGYSPDVPGDEVGPGTLTLGSAVTNVLVRAYINASTKTSLIRVGGGVKVDALTSSNLLTLANVRTAIARFWQMNVPEHPDGYFHCHLDPISQTQIFADNEFQRLLTSLPDYYMYKQFALGVLLNTVFFRNSECPVPETVVGGLTATFDYGDNFAGELYNTGVSSGMRVHRPLFVGQGFIHEYYQDLSNLITDVGITGKVAEPKITNNGIEVFSERIQLILRAPLNRMQDVVAASWKFIGDWPVRTDVTTGDGAAFKRACVIEHGE